VTSLITVGDAAQNGYRMVGIPDGLGALGGKFDNGRYVADKAFMTLFMNHELGGTAGVPRAHGTTGAFVSQWTLDLNSLEMRAGEDLIRKVYTWIGGTYVDSTHNTSFSRFCSADLPAASAFYDPRSGKGFRGRIFMNGEETGAEGRAFAHVVSGRDKGTSYELPYLGKMSFENTLAHARSGEKTLVVALEDGTPGQVYLYVGDKSKSGSPVQKAGLTGGKLFGIKVSGTARENNGPINGGFTLAEVQDAAFKTGAQIQLDSVAAGITEFARPEDGHWDTRNPNVFYFVTTGALIDGKSQSSRLYMLTFDSIANPTGGSIALVKDSVALTGTDGLPEDPGNKDYVAKVWRIDPASGAAVQIFESDRARFAKGGAQFLTVDEENSGVIEVTKLVKSARWYEHGRRYYLGVMQAHYAMPGELVEGGQLYIMASPPLGKGNKDDAHDQREEDEGDDD
jgi:hypothetical protein